MKIYFTNTPYGQRALIKKVFKRAAKMLGQPKSLEVGVNFLSLDQIQQLNKQHRQKDQPTDVLSFPTLDLGKQTVDMKALAASVNQHSKCLPIGDIFICPVVAYSQACQFQHSQRREVAYLALHGLLHLFGYDHENDEQEKEMNDKAQQILKKLRIERDNG